MDFEEIGQLLIIFFLFLKYFRKNENKMKQWISYLYAALKPNIQLWDSFFFNIRIEFGTPAPNKAAKLG